MFFGVNNGLYVESQTKDMSNMEEFTFIHYINVGHLTHSAPFRYQCSASYVLLSVLTFI